MSKLAELIERVEAATGPDRELDVAIGALWPDPPFNLTDKAMRNRKPPCPCFMSSIDAIVALIETKLPGAMRKIQDNPDSDDATATLIFGAGLLVSGTARTWPPALTLALLRALEAAAKVAK